MPQEMLNELLQQGESEVLEFKTSFGREAMETLVAFANAKGGRLLVGITNKRKVVGVSVSGESPQQWVNQVKAVTSPSIVPEAEVLKYKGKDVVLLWVPAYPVKPVSMKGKYFIREVCLQPFDEFGGNCQ